jgi:hypothetical protein
MALLSVRANLSLATVLNATVFHSQLPIARHQQTHFPNDIASRRPGAHEVTLSLPDGEWRDAVTGEVLRGGHVTLDASGGRVLLG